MNAHQEVKVQSYEFEQLMPKLFGETQVPITYDVSRKSLILHDMLEKQVSSFLDNTISWGSNEGTVFKQLVYSNHDRFAPFKFW